jgi:RNA-directed DNA polymerase
MTPFARVVRNLYAMPTPLVGGAPESKIEDFFGAATKAVSIDGKTFSDKNGFDVEKHYGKKVFAHKVVRPNADNIDFTGFRPLLATIVDVIKSHPAP